MAASYILTPAVSFTVQSGSNLIAPCLSRCALGKDNRKQQLVTPPLAYLLSFLEACWHIGQLLIKFAIMKFEERVARLEGAYEHMASKGEVAELRREFEVSAQRMVLKLGSLMIVITGVILTLIRQGAI